MTNSDMTPAWQTPLKDLHLARVWFRTFRASMVTWQNVEFDARILSFTRGSELELMSSIKDDRGKTQVDKAQDGIVYLSENPKTYLIKGMEKEAPLGEAGDVDLTNLASKLNNPDKPEHINFKNTVLTIVSKLRQPEGKPFPQDFSNEPDDIKRIKNLENALYLAEQAFDKLGDLNFSLKHLRGNNFEFIAEAYEACHLLLNLMTDAEQNFRNEINFIADGLAHALALANNPNAPRASFTSHDVGLTIGRAIEHRKPTSGEDGYDLLTYFGAVFPAYPVHIEKLRVSIKKLTSRNPEYTASINKEKMEELITQGKQLTRTIASSNQNSLYFVFNLMSLMRQTHTLWTHIYQEAGELNDTVKNLGREYLAILNYELLPVLFRGVDKLEMQLLLKPGRLSKPLMEQIKPRYESLVQTAKLLINFDQTNEHLLKIEDARFIELRLKPIQQKMETSIEALRLIVPALEALDAYLQNPEETIPADLEQYILALSPYMLDTDKPLLTRINKHSNYTWGHLASDWYNFVANWVTWSNEETQNKPNSANIERSLRQLKQRWEQLKPNHAFKVERYTLQIEEVQKQAHRVLYPSKTNTHIFQVSEQEILEDIYFLPENQPKKTDKDKDKNKNKRILYQKIGDDTYVQHPQTLSTHASWSLYRSYEQQIQQLKQASADCSSLLNAIEHHNAWKTAQTLRFPTPYVLALLDNNVMHQPKNIYVKIQDGVLQYQVLKATDGPYTLYLMTLEEAIDAGHKGYIWDHDQNQLSYIAEDKSVQAKVKLTNTAFLKFFIKGQNSKLGQSNHLQLTEEILQRTITSRGGHHPGVIQKSSIPLSVLGCSLAELTALEALQQFLPHILNELLERGHIQDEFKSNCIRWYSSIQPYISDLEFDARFTHLCSGSFTKKVSKNTPHIAIADANRAWSSTQVALENQIEKLKIKRDAFKEQIQNKPFKRPSELSARLKRREFLQDTAQFMTSLDPIQRQLHNSKKTCFKIDLALTHLNTNDPNARLKIEDHPWFQDIYVGSIAHATSLEIEMQLKQMLAYETLQITRNEQLVIQFGYDLVLMSNLPNHDEKKAIPGEIYLDEINQDNSSSRYIVLGENGEILRGRLEGITLNQLKRDLNNLSLKKAILEKISKADHTPQLKTRSSAQPTTHKEDDAFMSFGHIYEPVVMQEKSQKKPGELQLSIKNDLLYYRFMHYGHELEGEIDLQDIKPALTEFNENTVVPNDTLICILKTVYTRRKQKIDSKLETPLPEEALDLYQWYLDHHKNSDKRALYKSNAEKKPAAIEKKHEENAPENRLDHLVKHTRLSQYLNNLKSDIYQHIGILSTPLKQELELTHSRHLLPYPEVGAQNSLIDFLKAALGTHMLNAAVKIETCMLSVALEIPTSDEGPEYDTLSSLKEPQQVLLFKRLLNMIHYLEQIVLEMEKVNNKELQVSYVMHLVISYLYFQEILPLLSELKQDPVCSSLYADIAHHIEHFYKKINHESKYYIETNHPDDKGKNKQTALYSTLNLLKMLPERLASSTDDFEKKRPKLKQATEKSVRNIEKIIQHYNSSWSYVLLLLDLPSIKHLLGDMHHDIKLLLKNSHEATLSNLGHLKTEYLAKIILETDRVEHKLGLAPGLISQPIKEVMDEFYKGLITPLTPSVDQQIQLLCGTPSLPERIKTAESRKNSAKADTIQYKKAAETIQTLLKTCDDVQNPKDKTDYSDLDDDYQSSLATLKASLNNSDVHLLSIQDALDIKLQDCFVFDEKKSELYHLDALGKPNPQTGCKLYLKSIPSNQNKPLILDHEIDLFHPDDADNEAIPKKNKKKIRAKLPTLVQHGSTYYIYANVDNKGWKYTELNTEVIASMHLNFSRTKPLDIHKKYQGLYDELTAKTGLIYPIHLKNTFKTLRFISKKKEANIAFEKPAEILYLSEHAISEYISSNSNFALPQHKLSIQPGCCLVSLKAKPNDFYELELPAGYSSYYAQICEYDLGLILSLNDDLSTAKSGVIYLSQNPKQYFVKGMKKPVTIKENNKEINLESLRTRLQDADLKRAIFNITSKAGHTPERTDVLYYIDTETSSITTLPIPEIKQGTDATKTLKDTRKDEIFDAHDFKNMWYLTGHGCCLISLDTQPTDFYKLKLPVGYGSYYAQVGSNTDVLYYINAQTYSIKELPIAIEKQKTRDEKPTKEIEKLEETKKNKAFNTNDFKNMAYLTDHTPDLNGHTPDVSLMIDINNFKPNAQNFEKLQQLAERSQAYYQGMIKTSTIAEAVADDQLTYLTGYRFALLSSLRGDLTRAQGSTVYLSDTPKAYFVKGMEKAVLFTPADEVDLTNLAEKIKAPEFQKTILTMTAKAGHTLVENQKDKQENTGPTPLICQKDKQKEHNDAIKKTIYTDYFNSSAEGLASEKIDLQSYTLRPLTKDTILRPNRLYINLRDGGFEYRVINPAGKERGKSKQEKPNLIYLAEIKWSKNKQPESIDELIPYLPKILEITAKKGDGHTRPHSLADDYKANLAKSLDLIKEQAVAAAIASGRSTAIDQALANQKDEFNNEQRKHYEQLDAVNQAVGEFRLYLSRTRKKSHKTSCFFESMDTLASKTAALDHIDTLSANLSKSPEERIQAIQKFLKSPMIADNLMAYHTYTSTSLKSLLQCVFRLFEAVGLYTPEMTQRLDKIVDTVKRHEPPPPPANNPWSFFSKTTREEIKEKIATPKPSDPAPD